MYWSSTIHNNNNTSTPDNQSLVLRHTSRLVLSTLRLVQGQPYIPQKNPFLNPSQESFLRFGEGQQKTQV
jgi:hypothetical protein